MNELVKAVQPHEAKVNVTYAGQNGDLPDPVSFDANDGDIKQWLTEAISNGGIPGIPTVQADLRDFVVDRFTATETRPYNLLQVRPKTPFGAEAAKKLKCQPCGLDADHKDIADCMKDLMNYLEPEIRAQEKFQAVIDAGYQAMKRELDTQRIGEESTADGI